MAKISDMQIGKAGEYLVCADLILSGHIAFLSEQGLPFDVIAEANKRLIKIQVKTTRSPRNVPQRKQPQAGYLFHVKRCGKGGQQTYKSESVDIFALVSLDNRQIAYIPACEIKRTMTFRPPEMAGTYADDAHAIRAKQIKKMRETGVTYAAIAKEFGRDLAFVHRVCKGTSGTPRTNVRYLLDYTFDEALLKIS